MNPTLVASEILQVLMRHRRSAAGSSCRPRVCRECARTHLPRLNRFIARREPLHFVLPAFPAKSPNPRKVLGPLPDMAERLALIFLQSLCATLQSVYPPGATITVCSDGRVFSDLVRVPDAAITAYGQHLRAAAREVGAGSIDFFNLDDVFAGGDFDAMRRWLTDAHGEPLPQLRRRAREEAAELRLYNGISRFLFEDLVALEPARSRNSVRKEAGELAYGVIQRSHAWGALVGQRFPDSVRLSIHPQPCESPKIGIHMAATEDDWLTPWHSVAVDVEGSFVLMKRSDAEGRGALLVHRDGRPSHYVLPMDFYQEELPCTKQAA